MTSTVRMLAASVCVASALILPAAPVAAGCNAFEWANPWPQGNHLRAVASGAGVFVAVGDRGVILRSVDGSDWFAPTPLSHDDLYDVRWTDLGFVAVGDRGMALRSDDGLHWEAFYAGTLRNLRTVAWTGSLLVIATDRTPLVSTTDLVEWTVTEIEPMEPVAMEWGNGIFVAITRTDVLVSTSGAVWTEVAHSPNADLNDLTFTGSRFVIGGGGGLLWMSDDGSNWVIGDTGVNSDLFAVNGDAGFLVAVGQNGIAMTSTNDETWSWWDSHAELDLLALSFSEAVGFVAVGEHGVLASARAVRDWSIHSRYPVTADLVAVAPFGSRFVAVSGRLPAKAPSRLYWSDDGATWAQGTLVGSVYLADVSCGPSACVAVGEGRVAASADGVAWQARDLPGVDLRGVAWEGGRYVAVGLRGSAGAILTSLDGVVWDDVTPPGGPVFADVAASPTTWVAVGPHGAVATSGSGSHWTMHPLDTTKDVRAVAWTGERFVAVGDRSLIAVSDDGVEWAVLPAPTSAEPAKAGVTTFRNVARIGDGVAIVGDEGAMLFSVDGITWRWREFPTAAVLTAVAWNSQQEVVVGSMGTILRRYCPPRVRWPGDRVEAH